MSADAPRPPVTVTLTHLRALIDSTAESPVVYQDEDLDVRVGPSTFAPVGSVILSQEALVDFLRLHDSSSAVKWNDPTELELFEDLLSDLNSAR